MDFAQAKRKVLDLLRQKGRAKESVMIAALDNDYALFERVRQDLIYKGCIEEHKQVDLVYTKGPQADSGEAEPAVPNVKLGAKPERKLYIFLSYGHDMHADVAYQLKDDLLRRGHEVWIDRQELVPGTSWEHRIEDGLEWAAGHKHGRVVLLMTPHSVRRPDGYCLNEVARAVEKSIRIVPVMLVQVEPPLSICRIQWLDLRDCVPFEERRQSFQNKLPLLISALEGDGLDCEGVQSRLLSILKPVSFEADLSQHLRRFTGRQWLIDKIDGWIKATRGPQLLWITGGPGVGKTAIACWLSAHRREIAAFHICRHGHKQKGDPRSIVRSIAWQLSSQLPDYFNLLKSMVDLREICEEGDAGTLFDRLIVEPFNYKVPSPDRPIVVLIDALDEVAQEGQNELAAFLAQGIIRLPSWMRLIVTSRPDDGIRQALQGYDPLYIASDSQQNASDIKAFLQNHLRRYAADQEQLTEAVESIVDSSEGCFLYAEWIRRELETGTLSLERLDEFPKGLGGVYTEFFRRRFPNLEVYKETYRPVLESVCAAQEPISLNLLKKIFGWSVYDEREIPAAFGALFSVHEELFEPFHRSLVQWLSDPQRAGCYFASTEPGHQRLARHGWKEYQSGVATMSVYMKAHLPRHLKEAGDTDNLETCVTDGLFVYHYGKVGFLHGVAEFWKDIDRETLVRRCLESIDRRKNRQCEDRPFLALCALSLGRLFQQRGEYNTAIRCFHKSLTLIRAAEGENTLARAHFHIGWCLRHMEKFNKAIENLQQASIQFSDLNDLSREARSLSAIGICHWHFHQDGKALDALEEALRLFESTKDQRHHAEAMNHIGIIYRSIGQYKRALTYFRQAEKIFSKIHDLKGMGKLYNSMGTACWWRGRLKDAFRWYEKADAMNKTVDQPYVLGLTANNRGYLFLESGNYFKAYAEFKRARAIRQKLKSVGYEMMDLSGMARAVFHANHLEDARQMSRQALHTLATYRKVEDLRRAYFNHYIIFRKGNHAEHREACGALMHARRLVDERLRTLDRPAYRFTFIDKVPLIKEILSISGRLMKSQST